MRKIVIEVDNVDDEAKRQISIAIDKRIRELLENVGSYYARGNIQDAKETCDIVKNLVSVKIKIIGE